MCSERERVRFLTRGRSVQRKREEKRSLLCQWALTLKRTLYGAAAHFSSLSTLLPLMQLAYEAEATPSPLRERSIFSVGFVPLSSSI